MKKSEKVLKVIIGIIYAVVAAVWLIWVFATATNFAGGYLAMYFIPVVIMLGIAGMGINRLMKDKDKVLDAVIFFAFQVLILVIALITNGSTQIAANGDIEISWAGRIFALYSAVSVFTVVGGILAVVLAAVKKKMSK